MAIAFNDNIRAEVNRPLDFKFGPFISTAEASAVIPIEQRYHGLIFGVYTEPGNLPISDVNFFYFCEDLITIKPLNGYEEISFTEILNLQQNNLLIVGRFYLLANYRTIHLIPGTTDIHTGELEPLMLLAVSANQFARNVTSVTFPEDIIHFDFNDIVCEDGITPRRGKIVYRFEPAKDTYTHYDFRNVKFRRRKITSKQEESITSLTSSTLDCLLTFSTGTNLASNFFTATNRRLHMQVGAITHDAGALTLTVRKGTGTLTKPLLKYDGTAWLANELANTSGILTNCTVRDAYVFMNYRTFGKEIVDTYSAISNTSLQTHGDGLRYNVDLEDFEDYFTFNSTYFGVHIDKFNNAQIGNNIVFLNSANFVHIGSNSYNLTFRGPVYNLFSGHEIFNNIFAGEVKWSTFRKELVNSYFAIGFNHCNINEHITGNTIYPPQFGFITDYELRNNTIHFNGSFVKVGNFIENSSIFLNGVFGSSGRASTIFTSIITSSLVGYFNADNLILNKRLLNTSFYEVPAVHNYVKSLNIENTPSAIGAITLLGRDSDGNIVEATEENGLVTTGTYSQLVNEVTVNPDWVWRVVNISYQKLIATVFNITLTDVNFTRIDLISGNNAGDVIITQGTAEEDPSVALPPSMPANNVGLFLVFVNNSGISSFENFALSSFVRFDINNQGLSLVQRQNARTNIQALSKDTNDSRTGSLTQTGATVVNGSFTQTGRPFRVNFINDTASAEGFIIQNTVGTNPGGLRMQERGSTKIRARGDSVTGYFILKLQNNNSTETDVFAVLGTDGYTEIGRSAVPLTTVLLRVFGKVAHAVATNSDESTTLAQVESLIATALNDIVAGESYQGTWNASTNTPTLVSSVGTLGHYYQVNVAGSTTLDGISSWDAGDEVFFNGTVWLKRASFGIKTINSKSGANVTLNQDEVPDGAVYVQYSQTEKTKLAGIEELADVTDAVNIGTSINGVAEKTTPVDADTVPLTDSADSNLLKKLSWANIKATLKTYFDTLYNLYVHPNHSGDVTSVADGATTIADDVVSNQKLANMTSSTIKGRSTAGTGDPEDLTASQVRTILNVADGANNYTHPNHTGDVTSTGDGLTVIANNVVSDAKLRDSTGLSVIGRTSDTTGDPADITAGTDHHVLRRSGTSVSFGPVNIAEANATSGNLPVNKGGTGRATATTAYGLIAAGTTATGAQQTVNPGTSGQALLSNGPSALPTFQTVDFNATHTGDVTGATVLTIANDAVTNAKLANVATATIKGRVTAATGDPEDLTATQVRTLLNVEDGANNYVHPATHPPSIIVQDSSNRFVTDAEKSTWNGKQDALVSGTNIKTVGSTSILGSGDIPLPTGVSWVSVPVNKTATGSAGQFARDANFIYHCYATNLWERTPIDTSNWSNA